MKCKGVKNDGTACQSNALEGSEYCRHHQPDELTQKLDNITESAQNEILETPYAKQFWRYISVNNQFYGDAWPMYAVDEYLNQWYNAGYKLHTAFVFDRNELGVGVMYILTK